MFKLISVTHAWYFTCEIGLRWLPLESTDKWTLVQVMACCRQVTGRYLRQCWRRFMQPYGVSRPQRVRLCIWISPKVVPKGIIMTHFSEAYMRRRPSFCWWRYCHNRRTGYFAYCITYRSYRTNFVDGAIVITDRQDTLRIVLRTEVIEQISTKPRIYPPKEVLCLLSIQILGQASNSNSDISKRCCVRKCAWLLYTVHPEHISTVVFPSSVVVA